jgi:hypothetical protein
MYVDVDNGPDTINKKIRNGELAQYNFIFGKQKLVFLFSLIIHPVYPPKWLAKKNSIPNRSMCEFGTMRKRKVEASCILLRKL